MPDFNYFNIFGPPPQPALDLATIDGTNGANITFGGSVNENAGASVALAGDINGDGYADFIIGAPQAYAPGNLRPGAAFVVFGSASGLPANLDLASLDGTNGFRINGQTAIASTDYLGMSVASAGDLNHDGYDDLIVGAPFADATAYNEDQGAAYVIFGHAGPFAAALNVANLDGTNGFRMGGISNLDHLGYSVAGVGDINGDGLDDMVISAQGLDPQGRDYAGGAYVVFGTQAGFGPNFSLAGLDGTNGFRVDGAAASDFTRHVSAAGDFNHDGYDDFLVGARLTDPHGVTQAGTVYLVYGHGGAFNASLDLAGIDGTNGVAFDGASNMDQLDVAAAAGDINGDGFADILVGSTDLYVGGVRTGGAYVVFGTSAGLPAHFDVSALDGTNGFRLTEGSGFLGGALSSAGDFNGDGFDDLILGDGYTYGNYGGRVGSAWIVFGKAGGFSAVVDLTTLQGTTGLRINGNHDQGKAGFSVAGLGDINHDGFDDVLIGRRGDPTTATIVYGHSTAAAPITQTGTTGNDTLTGDAAGDTLSGGAGNDVLNGMGGADSLTGGTGDDTYYVDNTGDTTVEGLNEGIDIVHSTITWTLAANVEKLILDGSAAINGTGNGINNTITGNAAANTLDGGDGNDILDGGDGDDVLIGGVGNDIVTGAGDDDTLSGGVGNDKLFGGSGVDHLDGGDGADQMDGGSGDDVLVGGAGNDSLDGGTGADAMTGGAGNDIFYVDNAGDTTAELAGEGTDIVRASISWTLAANIETLQLQGTGDLNGTGNDGNNNLQGTDGANVLDGGLGNDTIGGGLGADTIIGGAGNDLLTGGNGADTFVIGQASVGGSLETDFVYDLIAADGDKLDLSGVDADSATAGDQGFHLVGAFTHAAGEMTLAYTVATNQTLLRLDVNGDGVADYQMKITGDVHADSGGWIL